MKKLSWKMFLFSGLADFSLLILGGFVYNLFIDRFSEKLYHFSILATAGQYTLEDLLTNTTARSVDMVLEMRALKNDIINLLLLTLFFLYLIYSATQSVSWYIIKKYSKEKVNFLQYSLKFFKNNLVLLIGVVVIAFIVVKSIFNPFVAITPANIQKIILVIAALFILLLIFFIFPSYIRLSSKPIIKFCIKNFGKLFILYVQAALLLIFLYYLVVLSAKLHWLLSFFLGLFLFLPGSTLVKYYLNSKIMKL